MTPLPLTVWPVHAPVQTGTFDLHTTLTEALADSDVALQDGDVLAVSSKYAAISEGRVVRMAEVVVTPEADALAERYHMNAVMAQLVLQEADHIFGGIQLGFLLTAFSRPTPGWIAPIFPAGTSCFFHAIRMLPLKVSGWRCASGWGSTSG